MDYSGTWLCGSGSILSSSHSIVLWYIRNAMRGLVDEDANNREITDKHQVSQCWLMQVDACADDAQTPDCDQSLCRDEKEGRLWCVTLSLAAVRTQVVTFRSYHTWKEKPDWKPLIPRCEARCVSILLQPRPPVLSLHPWCTRGQRSARMREWNLICTTRFHYSPLTVQVPLC